MKPLNVIPSFDMNCVHGTEITETCAHGETMKPNLNFRMQMSALTYMYISVAKITGIVCARRFQDLQNRNLKINLANKQTNKNDVIPGQRTSLLAFFNLPKL